MNDHDFSTDSSDNPENALSDNSVISDTDEHILETNDEKLGGNVTMDDWQVLSERCSYHVPGQLLNFSSGYDFHPAIDLEECKDPANYFKCFVSSNIVVILCQRTSRRAGMYFNKIQIQGKFMGFTRGNSVQ